jgi:REP element-mobilizing transposase RayT
MAVHHLVTTPGIYFITFTCHKWLHLFQITNSYDLVYKWFDILQTKGHIITGFVIMPNHLHMLLHLAGGGQSLNTIVRNGKRFMAYEIVQRLSNLGEAEILKSLQLAVASKDRSRGKLHEVWKDSFDVKQCRTEPFILQKLNYIHHNPCSGKWKLVKEPHHYLHSSALFYLNGNTAGYRFTDYRKFFPLLEQDFL